MQHVEISVITAHPREEHHCTCPDVRVVVGECLLELPVELVLAEPPSSEVQERVEVRPVVGCELEWALALKLVDDDRH